MVLISIFTDIETEAQRDLLTWSHSVNKRARIKILVCLTPTPDSTPSKNHLKGKTDWVGRDRTQIKVRSRQRIS